MLAKNVLEVKVVEENLTSQERICFGVVKIDLNKYPKGQIIGTGNFCEISQFVF
jgi:hypothetical protein